jgi:tryptophan-rich sensory protein
MSDVIGGAAPERRPPRRGIGWALAAIVPVGVVGVLGSAATLPNIPSWYQGLAKPPLTPPNAIFGPTWTILYLMMAVAIWRVLSRPGDRPGRQRAVVVYFVQLALNTAWSWVFFALHSPVLGLVVILALLVAIVTTIRFFAGIDRVAAWLLAPYLAWVAFASYLNAGVWWLN